MTDLGLFHHHLILYILNNFAEHIQTDTLRKFPTAWGMKPHIRGIRSPRCGGKLRLEWMSGNQRNTTANKKPTRNVRAPMIHYCLTAILTGYYEECLDCLYPCLTPDGSRTVVCWRHGRNVICPSGRLCFWIPDFALMLSATAGPLFSHVLHGPLAFLRNFSAGVQLFLTVMQDDPSSV